MLKGFTKHQYLSLRNVETNDERGLSSKNERDSPRKFRYEFSCVEHGYRISSMEI